MLKAIKEIELDYQMRKIAERDYREMVERYRTRAMRLMSEIEAGDDFRALIERELDDAPEAAMAPRRAGAARRRPLRRCAAAASPRPPTPARRACAAARTANDDDAQFCKKCGRDSALMRRRAGGLLTLAALLPVTSARRTRSR